MELYLDTADREAALPLLATGAFRGITTNPVILQRAGLGSDDIPAVHDWAVAGGADLVFLQTWGATAEEMAGRGQRLAGLSERVVVKLPATLAGTTALAQLAAEGVPTLLTAAHTVAHAVLAGAAGARWVAPYVSKVDDDEGTAVGVVAAMHRALSGGSTTAVVDPPRTAVLAASLRSLDAVGDLAAAGVPAATLGTALAEQLFTHPQTLDADRRFHEAAR